MSVYPASGIQHLESDLNFLTKNRLAYLYVLMGAALWGIIGIFVEDLSRAGFTSLQIVTLRVVSAAIMLTVYLALKNPGLLKIEIRDSFSFVGTGIFSIVFFNWCYFTAIDEISLSIAVILLYTGPAFVVILSWILFGEPMTSRKIIALLLTLAGCLLVVNIFPLNIQSLNFFGLLVGLGSGFGYALYSIFGKHALRKYESLTVITYTFLFASAVMLPVSGIFIEPDQLSSPRVWPVIVGLGFFPTVVAYLLYTTGLSMVESSRASIAATLEPVVATFVGVLVFDEFLTVYQWLGILLVLAAVVLIQLKRKKVTGT